MDSEEEWRGRQNKMLLNPWFERENGMFFVQPNTARCCLSLIKGTHRELGDKVEVTYPSHSCLLSTCI